MMNNHLPITTYWGGSFMGKIYKQEIADAIRNLCIPLFQNFNLTTFSYMKTNRNDPQFLYLHTNAHWVNSFLEVDKSKGVPLSKSDIFVKEGVFQPHFWSLYPDSEMNQLLWHFNIGNGYSLYMKTGETIHKFAFGADRQAAEVQRLYNEMPSIFEHFALYFFNRLNEINPVLLKECYFNWSIIPSFKEMSEYDQSIYRKFLTELDSKQFCLLTSPIGRTFTRRELQLLQQIARSLNLTY
ncbi:MAG TPA: hypothetical protein VNJ29_01625 [Candidatus Nitrosotenuis sp.]|nr:hypothetical protein [Candidatus Nitrosotenuis sp.]